MLRKQILIIQLIPYFKLVDLTIYHVEGRNLIKNEIIDTVILARDKFPGSSNSLDALCKRYRIDNSKREKHTALIDCDLLSKVYINLIDQKEPKLNFINETIDNYQMSKTNTSIFPPVDFLLTTLTLCT